MKLHASVTDKIVSVVLCRNYELCTVVHISRAPARGEQGGQAPTWKKSVWAALEILAVV